MQRRSTQPSHAITRQPRRSRRAPLSAAIGLALAAVYAAPAAAVGCSDLVNLVLPNTTITLAQSYAAGATVSGATKAPVGLCRVAGTVKPGSKSNVHFEVW